MSPTERAYLAGIVDGEGHIIYGNRRKSDVRMSTIALGVTNTDAELMRWIHAHLGGSVSRQRSGGVVGVRGGVSVRHKPVYKWAIDGERAAIVIRALLPYLIIKKNRATDRLDRWSASLATMERPRRREFHIRKQRAEMAALGWLS